MITYTDFLIQISTLAAAFTIYRKLTWNLYENCDLKQKYHKNKNINTRHRDGSTSKRFIKFTWFCHFSKLLT